MDPVPMAARGGGGLERSMHAVTPGTAPTAVDPALTSVRGGDGCKCVAARPPPPVVARGPTLSSGGDAQG